MLLFNHLVKRHLILHLTGLIPLLFLLRCLSIVLLNLVKISSLFLYLLIAHLRSVLRSLLLRLLIFSSELGQISVSSLLPRQVQVIQLVDSFPVRVVRYFPIVGCHFLH